MRILSLFIILPLISLIKHKKKKKQIKPHLPISTIYHLSCFFHKQTLLLKIAYHIDNLKNSFHKKIPRELYLAYIINSLQLYNYSSII